MSLKCVFWRTQAPLTPKPSYTSIKTKIAPYESFSAEKPNCLYFKKSWILKSDYQPSDQSFLHNAIFNFVKSHYLKNYSKALSDLYETVFAGHFLNTNRLIEIDKTNSKNPESIQSKKNFGQNRWWKLSWVRWLAKKNKWGAGVRKWLKKET